MIRTVDLVIAGDGHDALAAAAAALARGRRVLIVLGSRNGQAARRFRRRLQAIATVQARQLVVATNADVVCVDGIDGVEVVVIRHARTGRLRAVNASSFLSCAPAAGAGRRPPVRAGAR